MSQVVTVLYQWSHVLYLDQLIQTRVIITFEFTQANSKSRFILQQNSFPLLYPTAIEVTAFCVIPEKLTFSQIDSQKHFKELLLAQFLPKLIFEYKIQLLKLPMSDFPLNSLLNSFIINNRIFHIIFKPLNRDILLLISPKRRLIATIGRGNKTIENIIFIHFSDLHFQLSHLLIENSEESKMKRVKLTIFRCSYSFSRFYLLISLVSGYLTK